MSKRVLICDDSNIARQMIAEALRDDGWEVVGEAPDGEKVVTMYKDMKPDAVTMDLCMSHSDGLEGLKGIREHDPEAKIVVVSSLTRKDVVAEALRIGAVDYVPKPFVAEQLQQSMAACCSS